MKRKQLLSALLALIMLLSLLPVSSLAESDVELAEPAAVEQGIGEAPAEETPAVETPEELSAVEETAEEAPALKESFEETPAAEEPEPEAEPEEEPVVNAIVGQPQNLTVVSGERAVFSVEVTGTAVSFQWQSSRDGRRWSNLDSRTFGNGAELSFVPSRNDSGYSFRAVVSFADGEVLTSEAATLSVASLVITAQPQDASVEPNSEAVFTVGAKGSIYYYQWQYSANGSRWSNLNTRYYGSSNTLRFIAEAEDDGLLIRALVYGRDGNRLTSEAAKLTVAEAAADMPERVLAPAYSDPSLPVSVAVNAPAGALPADAVLNIAAVDAAPYEELTKALLGDEVEIGYALDINFSTEANGEIEPNGDVVVYLTVPGISEKKDVSVVHFSDDGVATKLDPVPAAELPRALGTDEIAIKTKDFSVFELTWTVGEDEKSATIHFGTVTGGTFTEFDQTDISFDTTASSINLANTFSGYSFLGAVYCEAGGDYASGVDIDTILYKGESGWNAYVTTRDDEDIPVTEFKPIAAGSDIYVVYYVPSAPVPSGSGDSTVPSPTTTKTVTPNADGTYTIQLDVAGATVTEDNSHYVNVLILLDATKSMQGTMWTNAKLAMKTLVETLCEGENAANAGKIDFALVTFGLSATVVQNWTKDNDAFKATCASQNLVSTTGTNWEAGLRGGLYGVLNKMPDDDPTYVIFLTDGDPNRYYTNDTGTNFDGTGIANGSNTTTAATRSQNEASAIAHKPTQLYGIYCGTTTSTSDASYKRLNDVITGQGGVKTIAATADTIESEFKAIAETALAEIGANNVSVDDGVPSLSSVSATTAGEAGGFEYYIGTKAEGASEPTYQTWTDAPGASYSNDNGVTWDLSSVGTVSEGSYYRLKFTVWPSQDAYDLIADLNNGLVTKTDAELDALGIAQNEQGVYYLMTNTHLNTNYKVGNTSYSDSPDTLPTEE